MWSGGIKRKLAVVASVIMIKLHPSYWETVVYETEIEAFIGFGKAVNDVRVVIPGYTAKSCGVPYVFGNKTFLCNFLM